VTANPSDDTINAAMSFDFMLFLVEGIGQPGAVQAFEDSAAFFYFLQLACKLTR
jgi:hypothetical protein